MMISNAAWQLRFFSQNMKTSHYEQETFWFCFDSFFGFILPNKKNLTYYNIMGFILAARQTANGQMGQLAG